MSEFCKRCATPMRDPADDICVECAEAPAALLCLDEERTNTGLLKYVEFEAIKSILDKEISLHRRELRGKSGHVIEWENGFVKGMEHIRRIVEKMRRTHEEEAPAALLGGTTEQTLPRPTRGRWWWWLASPSAKWEPVYVRRWGSRWEMMPFTYGSREWLPGVDGGKWVRLETPPVPPNIPS